MKQISVGFRLSCLAAVLLITVAFFNTQTPLVWAGEPHDFLKQINSRTFPKAHCVLAKEVDVIKVRDDGTYKERDEIFLSVLDEKGRDSQLVQRFFINKHYERLSVSKMEVIKPDGTAIEVDLDRNSRLTSPTSTSRMNIYDPSQKVLNVFLPGLEPGDTIHYVVETDNFKSMIPGQFYSRYTIQQSFPVRYIELELELPKGMVLHHLLKDRCPDSSVDLKKETRKGKTRYIWKFQHVREIVPEPYMPEPSRIAMRLLCSTISSWKAVSIWYWNLVEPKLKVDDEIKAVVESLTHDKKTDREKLQALFYFVARKIRYLGITEEANRPGFEPHDVTLTFSRRYGVCRDKAALLVAMLREAGYPAVPVMMRAGGKLDPEIAVPYFNHAIVAVMDENARPRLYMDPTSETSRQFLPDYEQDSSCLPATAQGTGLLLTPVKAPDSNLFVMEIKDRVGNDGVLRGNLKVTSAGFADTMFRTILMRKSKDEQEKFLKVFLIRKHPRLKIKNLSWHEPEDTSKNFSFQCDFEIPGALKRSGQFFAFSSASALGLMDAWLLNRAAMVKRSYPLKIDYTFKTVVKESVQIALPYCSIELPETVDIDNRFLSYRTAYSILKDGIDIEKSLSIRQLEIPPDKYHVLLRAQADLGASSLKAMEFVSCEGGTK